MDNCPTYGTGKDKIRKNLTFSLKKNFCFFSTENIIFLRFSLSFSVCFFGGGKPPPRKHIHPRAEGKGNRAAIEQNVHFVGAQAPNPCASNGTKCPFCAVGCKVCPPTSTEGKDPQRRGRGEQSASGASRPKKDPQERPSRGARDIVRPRRRQRAQPTNSACRNENCGAAKIKILRV